MKNFQKIAIALMVGVLAIGFSAFTNSIPNANGKFAGTYRLISTFTPPNWTDPIDPDATHYQLVTPGYQCKQSSKICTYSIDNNQVVSRLAQGTYQ